MQEASAVSISLQTINIIPYLYQEIKRMNIYSFFLAQCTQFIIGFHSEIRNALGYRSLDTSIGTHVLSPVNTIASVVVIIPAQTLPNPTTRTDNPEPTVLHLTDRPNSSVDQRPTKNGISEDMHTAYRGRPYSTLPQPETLKDGLSGSDSLLSISRTSSPFDYSAFGVFRADPDGSCLQRGIGFAFKVFASIVFRQSNRHAT